MATSQPNFPVSFRGYDRDQVDTHLRSLTQHLGTLENHVASLQSAFQTAQQEAEKNRALAADLQEQVNELGATGYTGLGLRVEKSLRHAEAHAERLLSQDRKSV